MAKRKARSVWVCPDAMNKCAAPYAYVFSGMCGRCNKRRIEFREVLPKKRKAAKRNGK